MPSVLKNPHISLCKQGWDSQVPGVDVKKVAVYVVHRSNFPLKKKYPTPPPLCESGAHKRVGGRSLYQPTSTVCRQKRLLASPDVTSTMLWLSYLCSYVCHRLRSSPSSVRCVLSMSSVVTGIGVVVVIVVVVVVYQRQWSVIPGIGVVIVMVVVVVVVVVVYQRQWSRKYSVSNELRFWGAETVLICQSRSVRSRSRVQSCEHWCVIGLEKNWRSQLQLYKILITSQGKLTSGTVIEYGHGTQELYPFVNTVYNTKFNWVFWRDKLVSPFLCIYWVIIEGMHCEWLVEGQVFWVFDVTQCRYFEHMQRRNRV